MSIDYDTALVESVSTTLDLRRPNVEALDAIAKALDGAEDGAELVADLATGVGKTYVAGALIDYLAESGVRNIVIITPGSTIQRKTIANLTPGNAKYLKGLSSNPLVITLDDLERGAVASALEDESRLKVFVFTVQSLLRPDTADARRAHRAHETLGQALYEYLQKCNDLFVIADEHHIYYSGSAKRFQSAIDELDPVAMIGLTATPNPESKARIVYHYPIASAIADGYVKIPVLVARTDGMSDLRTQMSDGVALLNAKATAMSAYCARVRLDEVKPVMFVVAKSIDEANEIKTMLSEPGMIGSVEQVLLVTSEEPDRTLAELDALEDPFSPYRAVVSVSMLKEGWDVKNIYVIASVRAMESELLTEQILGRGLRLPFGRRTGVAMLDTVEVLSHHAFADLLKRAKVLLQETLGDRANEAKAVVDPVAGINAVGISIAQASEIGSDDLSGISSVSISLPAQGRLTADGEMTLFYEEPSNVGMGFSTLEARIAEGEVARENLTTTLEPRSFGDVKMPMFLPMLKRRWERPAFSLTQINTIEVEALGRNFATDPGSHLIRKGVDVIRDKDSAQTHVEFYDEIDVIQASAALLDLDSIETDLAKRLLDSNGIESSIAEQNGAISIAKAFLRGAQVDKETTWRAEHGRLATAKLIEWIANQQAVLVPREVVEVSLTPWPEPPERFETQPPADRHVITSSADFTRGYPYKGWTRSIYSVASFDAFSTEFRLAELFDKSAGVTAWLRIDESVPLQIQYRQGSLTREYRPDIVLIDDAGRYWIVEGKANKDMTDPVVMAKSDAARSWVSTVNNSANITQKWGYLLASETVIAQATSWEALKTGGQLFSS
jgi:type III restriction enzyme